MHRLAHAEDFFYLINLIGGYEKKEDQAWYLSNTYIFLANMKVDNKGQGYGIICPRYKNLVRRKSNEVNKS